MSPQAAAFYLVVEMVSAAIPPAGRPIIGPMPKAECVALRLSIEAAAISSIASVECRQPKIMMACQLPGRPGSGYPCPVWDHGPLAGGSPAP